MDNEVTRIIRKRHEIDPAENLSPNFVWGEHLCKCGQCEDQFLHPDLYPMLEKLRAALGGRWIKITSGYRCYSHNKNIRGAKASKHLDGIAADIVVDDCLPFFVATTAKEIGFKGIKAYRSWCHVDLRTRRWHDF